MAFAKQDWKNRVARFLGRRRLTKTDVENVYDIRYAEGEVTEEGYLFDAKNMNNIEDRISDGMKNISDRDIALPADRKYSSQNLTGALNELHESIVNGKRLVLSSAGSSSSGNISNDQFVTEFNNAIKNHKSVIVNGIGAIPTGNANVNESFDSLINKITTYKKSFYLGNLNAATYTFTMSQYGSLVSGTHSITRSFGFVPSLVYVFGARITGTLYMAGDNSTEAYTSYMNFGSSNESYQLRGGQSSTGAARVYTTGYTANNFTVSFSFYPKYSGSTKTETGFAAGSQVTVEILSNTRVLALR